MEWTVEAGGEYRFEAAWDAHVPALAVELRTGRAEVFGSEMAPGRAYVLPRGCKAAVHAFEGATLRVHGGPPAVEYCVPGAADAPASDQHAALLAVTAALDHVRAPARLLVVGAGRCTVARILANYQARRLRAPPTCGALVVDADPVNGAAALFPGVLALRHVLHQGDIEADGQATATDTPPACLLSLFFGSLDLPANLKLYRAMTLRLAALLDARLLHSGPPHPPVIVIAPGAGLTTLMVPPAGTGTGTEDDAPVSLLAHLVRTFRITHVLAVGDERHFVTVSKHVDALRLQGAPNADPAHTPSAPVQLIKIPKSSGVVEKDQAHRRAWLSQRIHTYFYGPRAEYRPFALALTAAQLTIYRLAGSAELAPSSALPLGAKRRVDELRLVRLESLSSAMLLYSLLAVVLADTPEDTLPDAALHPVAGYVQVTEVDDAAQTLSVLSPCPGPLPSRFLLLGSIKYVEHQ